MHPDPLYQGLKPSDGFVRLLWLETSEDDEEIIGALLKYAIDCLPSYTAVSYFWGPAEHSRPIAVNGHIVYVRPNLHHFMQVYVRREHPTLLWIDQICIDQANESERNGQVSIMHEIYSKARQTMVWLGEDPHGGHGLATLRYFQTNTIEEVRSEPHRRAWAQGRDALTHLTHLVPYWKRHWIAQEVVLSKSVTVLYGNKEFAWKELERVSECCELLGMTDYCPSDRLHDLRKARHNTAQVFRVAMTFAQSSECMDVRDKIYGTQGMFLASYRVPVDYSLEPFELFLLAIVKWYPMRDWNTTYLIGCVCLARGMNLIDTWERVSLRDHVRRKLRRYLDHDGTQNMIDLDEIALTPEQLLELVQDCLSR